MMEHEMPPFPLPPDKWHEVAKKLNFSPKQKPIVELLLRNRCYKQIETALNMPHATLRTHIKRIYLKAQVSDREELIVALCALSHGICRPQG